jgi:hypothetical protein
VRHEHVPSAEQRPPRRLPAATQEVEQVAQQSAWGAGAGAGAARVVAPMASMALKRRVNCIFGVGFGGAGMVDRCESFEVFGWAFWGLGYRGSFIACFEGFSFELRAQVSGS